ncbi:hypothetical protein GCM10007301_31070 [Azorhizobium oxalatiphilum]|uniref:Uncharacterized protein n=1 Tax=Azorhizobium oxalatiphilum TaxID=980631 RepID=A0A917FC37_9HYPH|nr:hypothetical protein [Azorhizobium oxalatiphilum]GGF69172.1 hypothetical protein GCM10007301_31070 [Azorhizobium oxalatiphilum]
MADRRREALARLMDRFAQQHWNDRFPPEQAELSIEGDVLRCTVSGETMEGHASAPLLFASGAFGLIYAHATGDRFGHRVEGRINRVWPNGAGRSLVEHGLSAEVAALAALWPERLFSSALYDGVPTPGYPRRPRCLEDAPSRTTLSGILKRVAKSAGDADPLERLKVAEFIEHAVRREWSQTAADAMMQAVGAPLLALAEDAESAIRELALLALETCAFVCWAERAYGLYEPLCRRLIAAGLNADLHYARLAESAYAAGEEGEGDRLWAIATAGQKPTRALHLSQAFDHLGDWSDLHTRILRQAGGSNVAYAAGLDPNEARQAKRAKAGIESPPPEVAARHRAIAHRLLARAAEGADARLALDLPAIREGRKVPLGGGEIDPAERRLFLSTIFGLQSRLAEMEGNAQEQLRLLFRTLDVEWQLNGSTETWRSGSEEAVAARAAPLPDDRLTALGMPAYLWPLVRDARQAQVMEGSADGRRQLFWQDFMANVREEFHARTDLNYDPLPGAELVSGFSVTTSGGEMRISHAALAEPVAGPLSAPVLTALRAWHGALTGAHGKGAWFETSAYKIITLDASGVAEMAALAAETLAAGAETEAIALYRFAHGTDPLVQPWPYNDPVAPLSLDAVPEPLREAVAARSPLEENEGHAKLKPRGRRIEQLARDLDGADGVSARYIAHCLRDACGHAGDSEIPRALKAGQPLLVRLWQDENPQLGELAAIATLSMLHMRALYAQGLDADALMAVAGESGIADLSHVQREPAEL